MRANDILVTALAFGLWGCSGDGFSSPILPEGTRGELGNGEFYYECVDDADPVCDDGDADYPFDRDYAVGSSFSLFFRDNGGQSASVGSAAEERLSEHGNVFSAEKAGTVAVVAQSGDRVIDMLHLALREAAELRIESELTAGGPFFDGDAVELMVGDHIALRATPHDDEGDVLVGALPITWRSADPTHVSFDGSIHDNQVDLLAKLPGSVEVIVEMGEMTHTIVVTVVGDPPPFEPVAGAIDPTMHQISDQGGEP